jgi:uracil-DNA glycosylase family 4
VILLKRLSKLNERIIACTLCPRLRRYCQKVAREKRRAFQDWVYWGKPIPGFGDIHARLLILGLAPAAHGGNRTGRMFTGDRSGDFLFEALYRNGFSNQPTSKSRNDGLVLKDCYITASVRCAPPGNKPLPKEMENCFHYLLEEFRMLKRVKVVLVLGKIAFDTYFKLLQEQGYVFHKKDFLFKHGALYPISNQFPALAISYHPSQRNTLTGKLTSEMMDRVFNRIRKFLQLV